MGTLGGNPFYEIVNANSEMCLEVYHSSFSDGANVDQWTCNHTATQYWIDESVSYGGVLYDVFQNYNSGDVLEVYHSSTTGGANVDQWTYNGTATQLWFLGS